MTDFEKIFQQKYALTEKNQAQREAIDQIFGPVLVIAGPGTGKTQLLSTRIANILRQTDASPENILAMTFTDAGARNMRERLLTMIGTEAHKVGIFTYHGFANEIIQNHREYFIDRNLENQADDLAKFEILSKIKEELPFDSTLSAVSPSGLAGVIAEMKKALISPNELREIARENIRQQQAFHEEIKGLRVSGNNFKAVEPFYSQIIAALTSHNTESSATAKVGSNLGFYLAKLVEAFAEAEESGKSKPLTDWKNAFLDQKDQNNNFQIHDVFINKKLLEFADVYEKYMLEMKEHNFYDFDDMILEAIYALERHDDLRFTLQEKYQFLLLDEYQDTNEAQARIIELLTDNPAHEGKPNVLAVGDDDQAIMAFQGASKSNMIDFYRRFKPEDVKVINLTKNYRSHGDILDASKKVAEMISGRLTKNLPIEIEKNISAEGNFSGKKVDIVRANFASQVAEFAWVAEEIAKLIQSGVPAEEIAVIAPRHKILQDFSPYLKQQNVPIWYEKRENILEEEVVSWLVKIAKLVLAIREKDEAAMAELFPEVVSFEFWQIPTVEAWRMSWAARDKREFWIEACLESSNEQVRFLGEFLVALAEASQTKSFEEMFDLILGSREFNENLNLKSPIRAFLAQKSDEEFYDAMSVLTVLRDKLREFSGRDKNDLQDLVNFVNAYEQAEIKIINTNPHHSSDSAVQLMTPFSAKGLEFEHTFLISLTNKIWNSSKGGQRMISMPMNLKFTNIEDEGEDTRKRSLFVAMTRAKTHLYLTNFSSDFSGKNAPTLAFLDEREESGEMRTKILPESYQKVANLENLSPKIEDLQINWHEFYAPKTAQMRELLQPRIENFKLSPTNLNAFTDVEYGDGPRGFYENSILCFPESYGASATLGTLVHDGFNFIQDKINAGEMPKLESLQKKFQEKIAKYPLSESEKSEITERFNRIFARVFEAGLEKFKAGNIAEKSFSSAGVMVGDALLTGKIDLIQIDKTAKKITVLDYKTGSIPLGKNGQINRATSKIHKYEQQLYFYKILIENTPEFAGFKVEKGVLEFVEPSKKTGEIYTYEVDFSSEKEENLKRLIQAVWAKIKAFDFEFDETKYAKNLSGIRALEADLVKEFFGEK